MARASQASGRSQRPPHAKQRAAFTKLLLENPNYFGNFPQSGFEPILVLEANTAYEQLSCVGYSPERDELEATVQIKLPGGYGGDLCSAGSNEYVRFYVDYGAGWQDAGLASFNAHDIPNSTDCAQERTKPLTYVVTFPHDPKRAFCRRPVLPNVRAILSWNAIPPAGNPGWTPVWGNTLDRHVQIAPRPPFVIDLADAIAEGIAGKKAKLPKDLEFAQHHSVPLPPPPDPPFEELVELYREPKEGTEPVEPPASASRSCRRPRPSRSSASRRRRRSSPGGRRSDSTCRPPSPRSSRRRTTSPMSSSTASAWTTTAAGSSPR